ncbi:MAG: hypothetical protein J6T15_00560 [Bacilli bacterium]|nr:hypothetical protein [Bacilli bacterium]
MENQVKFFSRYNLFYMLGVVGIPTIIGGILALIFKDLLYLEAMYVIIGLIDLVIITVRLRIRDGQNYKKYKSIKEDKTTDDYKRWVYFQYIVAISGAIDLVLSVIVFAISTSI